MSETLKAINPADAEAAVVQLETTINDLLAVIEQETTLVRRGQVRQAFALENQKGVLARS